MPEQSSDQSVQTILQQKTQNQPIQKKPFWKYVLIFEILLLVFAVGYIGFKTYGQGEFKLTINSLNEVSEKLHADDSILVLLDTYKKPDDKYTVYRVQLDGSGETEIWSHTFFNDYQFSPLTFPSVNSSRKLLLYEEENDFLIIDSATGKERKIPKHHPDFFSGFDCIWNNGDTHIACAVRENKSTDFDQLLIVVDIKNGDEIVVNDSTKDELIFGKNSPVRLLGWDKNDQQIYLSSTRGDNTVLLSVDTNTKKVTSYEVGGKNIIRFDNAKYSAELNKFILDADRESTLYTFDPENSKKELLYDYKDKFIGRLHLAKIGIEVLFKEDNFYYSFDKNVEPKDGKPTSKIIKVNLKTGKKQEFEYPFDPNVDEKSIFTVLDFYDPKSNNVIIKTLSSDGNLFDKNDNFGVLLYSYNLDSKKLTKIFSRNKDDFPGQDFQFDVIP